jgi:hypothetical protein
MLRAGLEMRRRLFRHDHPDVANSLSALAGVVFLQSKWPEAEALYRESLNMRRNIQPNHPDLANAMTNLGMVLLYEKKGAEAEAVLREALTSMTARIAGPADAWRTAWVRYLLGSSLVLQQKFAEGEPLMVGAYEEVKGLPFFPVVRKNEMRASIRGLYEKWGRPDEAQKWLPTTVPTTSAATK